MLDRNVDRVLPRPPRAAGMCVTGGHRYGGPGGWRACACGRAMPGHAAAPLDPAGGPGCGMVWRVCADCAHIDEHHLTDHEPAEREPAEQGRGAAGVAA